VIIQVRGTSGSGKSTLVRRVMESIGEWNPVYVEGRKKPQWYISDEFPWLTVLGHYESPCGGCDTIGSSRAVHDLIRSLPDSVEVILCEGLLLSEDVKWSSTFGDRLVAYFLSTPTETCLSQIKARRLSVGNEKELNPNNTINRVGVIDRARRKLLDLGLMCPRGSFDQVHGYVLKRLRLHAERRKGNGPGTKLDLRPVAR